MAYRAGVVGASGYTGAELLRLVAAHPELEVAYATADTNAGSPIAQLYPSLAAAYPVLDYAAFSPGDLAGLDIVFVALPHGESQRHAATLLDAVPHVIDLGADFRLPVATYEQWYGSVHGAPELIDQFAFGLPELFRDDLQGAAHVAAPGCYPTTAALALSPLLAGGVVEPTGIVVNAVSGVSGQWPPPLCCQPVLRSQRERRGVRPADPSPHGRDGAGAESRRRSRCRAAVHAPSRADDAGHLRDVLRPSRSRGSRH